MLATLPSLERRYHGPMAPLRLLGGLLVVAGLVLVCAPTLVSDPGPAADTFAAIERRIPYGGIAGLGALFIARTQLRPWTVTVASVVLWVTTGLLVARCIGLVLDGADDQRQWLWVAVEAAIALAAGLYVRHRRDA